MTKNHEWLKTTPFILRAQVLQMCLQMSANVSAKVSVSTLCTAAVYLLVLVMMSAFAYVYWTT